MLSFGKRRYGAAPPLGENALENTSMTPTDVTNWSRDWAWGLPIIVLTVICHASGLGVINKDVISRLKRAVQTPSISCQPLFILGVTALFATLLHVVEVLGWAAAYRLLGAPPNNLSAILYSLNAMTSYGHVDIYLEPHWQMMGALEALNGWILFGLTTAFLFTVIQRAWSYTQKQSEPA
jgi:hypothetical protein